MAKSKPAPADLTLFTEEEPFQDDVHDPIPLNRLERDAIDTPEFQRLFRLGQLGLVDLLFQTANHTRGAHSIGTCGLAGHLVDMLNHNCARLVPTAPHISPAERVLIRLAGLLHDISHGPFSHDIERKSHLVFALNVDSATPTAQRPQVKMRSAFGSYDKHDDLKANPALYVALFDRKRSVLARVLRAHSPAFTDFLLQASHQQHAHLQDFLATIGPLASSHRFGWDVRSELLPSLLFHLLAVEKPDDADADGTINIAKAFGDRAEPWGLGPPTLWKTLHNQWYQPFRHDIVGNTLSADLLDYLQRDLSRLGLASKVDHKLLRYYVLTPWPRKTAKLWRCAIDLDDHKRHTVRVQRINDIFRLLDLRHQIHEKAVFHRVVQAAIAMLSRAVYLLDATERPSLESLYWPENDRSSALAGDERFLNLLVERAAVGVPSHGLAAKLAERRIYRPLFILPGDRVQALLDGLGAPNEEPMLQAELQIRALAAVVDSERFASFFLLVSWCVEAFLDHSLVDRAAVDEFLRKLVDTTGREERARRLGGRRVVFWVTPYKQLYKDPALLVTVDGKVGTIDHLGTDLEHRRFTSVKNRLKSGLADAESKYSSLWTLYVFASDGLFHTGILAKLLADHPCNTSTVAHEAHVRQAQQIVRSALRAAWAYFWRHDNKRAELLDQRLTADDLKQLIAKFLADEAEEAPDADDDWLLAPPVEGLVHGGHPEDVTRCRDVRYRFDNPAASPELTEASEFLSHLFNLLGVRWADLLEEEAHEVIARAKAMSTRIQLSKVPALRMAARAQDATELIRRIWLGPEADEVLNPQ